MNVEDRLDILQKIAEYAYTFDGKDAEGWANLFTEDGVRYGDDYQGLPTEL